MSEISAAAAGFISSARVGRLGTADASGQPLVVPICYAFDGAALFSAIDAKPKTSATERLKRIRNIRENPRVCLVIDQYDEDWQKLRYVMIQGDAAVLTSGSEFTHGADLLRAKYPQYQTMGLDREAGTMIKVTPARVIQWSFS